MSLQVPNYKSRFWAMPLPAAYAYISAFEVDIDAGQGRYTVEVYSDHASYTAGCPPVDALPIATGQVLVAPGPGVAPVQTRTLAQLLADPTFAAAWATVAQYLIEDAMLHPALAGAAEVP